METIPKVILLNVKREEDLPKNFLTHYQTHIYCKKGSFLFLFKGKKYECGKGDFVFWFAETDVKNVLFSQDFEGDVLLVEKQFLINNIPDQSWGIDVQLYSRENPILELSGKADKAKVLINFNRLNEAFQTKKHLFYEDVLNLQMKLFLFEMWNIFSSVYDRRKRSTQTGTLYERFQKLVQLHCMQEREVSFYAEKLNITPKYLNFVCKQNSGTTASEWIQRNAKERIIILLHRKNLNISEIADEMNFSSRSFFTKKKKKLLGATPKEFRERLG